MKRRAFITLLGGTAAAWPLAARAQQAAVPAIGLLDIRSSEAMGDRLRAFRQGLAETGYVEGDNVTIVYRWAENKLDQVPELAADLVGRRVAVMLAGGSTSVVLAAKAGTTTIPILFIVPEDPVRLGLVTSLARPAGNLTGINFFSTELIAKQLAFLHEMVPKAARVAIFVNPVNAASLEAVERDAPSAGRALGLQLEMLRASTSREIDAAFAPTLPFVAPPFTVDAEADPGVRQFTVPVSFTGFPALSVPCGFSSSGLPIGLQIVANDFQEQLLFRIAGALEREIGLNSRLPSTYWSGRGH